MLAADNAPVATVRPSFQLVDVPEGDGEPAGNDVVVEDNYAWLRGKNWPNEVVEEPEIIR